MSSAAEISATETNNWLPICPISELVPFIGVRALLGKEQVAIFSVNDNLYAISAIDPFTKMAVLSRGIVGDLRGQVVVASPIYKQHFNLKTGQCLEDEDVTVKVYSVRNNGGMIELSN